MIRFIKILILLAILAGLIVMALANREIITLHLLTPDLEDYAGRSWSIDLPVYVVVLAGVALGLIIGYILEWLRETEQRQEAIKRRQQVIALKREVARLKGENPAATDEVIAILEAPKKTAG